ncbi:MAG: precorrin-3B C(17)-methyltransferase [Thermodesulfobacteriota bacterium]
MVGIGPGGPLDRTRRAEQAIGNSQVIVGYRLYLDMISDLTTGKELISSGMTREVDRTRAALDRASQGAAVALVSSGDAGIYGMAGLALEMAASYPVHIPIEVVPGITSSSAVAARLGAPLMLDYAVISLSDLLVPWDAIRRRLEAVAAADLVVALYNPRSKKRTAQLEEAQRIFRAHRGGNTPVGVGRAVGTADEHVVLSDLDHFLELDIDMRTTVVVGNTSSRVVQGWFVTPRGYGMD